MLQVFFLTVIGFSVALAAWYALISFDTTSAGLQMHVAERFGAAMSVLVFAVTGPVLLAAQALSHEPATPARRIATATISLVWALDLGLVVWLFGTGRVLL